MSSNENPANSLENTICTFNNEISTLIKVLSSQARVK